MQKEIELLAPGGDVKSIKAAIAAGADAVYCGLSKFNARNRASNISYDDLNGVIRLAHLNRCKVFLTLNILIIESEIPELVSLLNRLTSTGIDGLIVQDLGLFYLLSKYFPGLKIHASTQLTTHNEGQVKFLAMLDATRVNLSRELNLEEIASLSGIARQHNMLTEVFVHGSYCISFSGLCYMSSVLGGNSGNRGRCSQSCRDRYDITSRGWKYPLNLRDNAAWQNLKEISDAGVDSIKIEGRNKQFHYVYTVVDAYREQLQKLRAGEKTPAENRSLHKTFNRGFSNGFLKGKISAEMFIDNPRDQSSTGPAEFARIRSGVQEITESMSIEKTPLSISVSGKKATPLEVEIRTEGNSHVFFSDILLSERGARPLDEKELLKRFRSFNDTAYHIKELEMDRLQAGLHIPFGELNSLKNRILFFLRDSRTGAESVRLPALKRAKAISTSPVLQVLVASREDLEHCPESGADIFFQLPDSISGQVLELNRLFRERRNITPWFPAVLIGKDFSDAVKFLRELQPERLVTDNTGIAYEASKMEISWIAGPRLNLVNSYSLLSLKEGFKCKGAFISNELNRLQISGIRKPENFDLFYSIFHPIELMVSRQCLFHQVTGCNKNEFDGQCLENCHKSASLTNKTAGTLLIDKKPGAYNRLYHEQHFLNTQILADMPGTFSGFLIDVRDIKTQTLVETEKSELIRHFQELVRGSRNSQAKLEDLIKHTGHTQYLRGI